MIPFDDEVKWILGLPNFACAGFAQALRKDGKVIANKAEDEQAYVLYWMLELYEKHGKNWRKVANEFLEKMKG